MSAKTILVTGASRGIGLDIAKALVAANHQVVVTARSTEELEKLKLIAPKRVAYLAGDMADFSLPSRLVDLAVSTFGGLDGVVVNHGVLAPINKLADAPLDEWKSLYDVNLFSGIALAKAAIPALRTSHGMVVWISSGAATNNYTSWSAYGSSKAAINSISAHLAAEEPEITSFALAPGVVATDMQTQIRASKNMDPTQLARFVDLHQSDKLLKPEWVGAVVAKIVTKQDVTLSGKFLRITDPALAAYAP
ncbi:putative oxidoreductase [Ceratocystis platani]|uniref:Putative oxidoreductase n=1 Tax=Ceratocystis fimbriata f. sp. platani TaxID=88771 RepID=A0A0F8CYL6_CERFI|nr:putative oxidoreductase [Ceratocystis platani]